MALTVSSYFLEHNEHPQLKWGKPVYGLKKDVLALGFHKKHLSINFFRGQEFHSDPLNLFDPSSLAKQMKTIKVPMDCTLNPEQLLPYILQGIKLDASPLKKQIKAIKVPNQIQSLLDTQSESGIFFENLSYTNRKELIQYFLEAKKESTRDKRLKIIEKLLANKLKLEEKKLLN